MIAWICSRIGHERCAGFLIEQLPIGTLRVLTLYFLGRLTAMDEELQQMIVPEIKIQDLLDAMKREERTAV